MIPMAAFPKKITIIAWLFLIAVVSVAAYSKYTDDLAKKSTTTGFMFGGVPAKIGQPTSDGHESPNSNVTMPNTESNSTIFLPPAADSGVPKKSYNEFIASLPATTNLLLPDKLPRGLVPTNAVGSNPAYFILIDYSSKGYDTLAQSELGLQITSTSQDPYPQNITVGGTHFKIGNWSAFYDPKAPEFEPEYIQLYGHTCGLLNVRVGSMNYQFRAIPDITYDELIQIVENMKPVQ